MRKLMTVAAAVVVLCMAAAGQDKKDNGGSLSDFEGTWLVHDDFVRSYGRQTWTISVSGSVLKISQDLHFNNSRNEFVLPVNDQWAEIKDSKGETTKSKISWKNGKVVREYSYKRRTSLNMAGVLEQQYSTANVVETYYLSDKGSKLVFRRDDDSIWPNRNTPTKMGRGFEHKVILIRKK